MLVEAAGGEGGVAADAGDIKVGDTVQLGYVDQSRTTTSTPTRRCTRRSPKVSST
ncbi:MAG: hypothetical protein R2697_08675 [Ilumatobacteraceae bacterium]